MESPDERLMTQAIWSSKNGCLWYSGADMATSRADSSRAWAGISNKSQASRAVHGFFDSSTSRAVGLPARARLVCSWLCRIQITYIVIRSYILYATMFKRIFDIGVILSFLPSHLSPWSSPGHCLVAYSVVCCAVPGRRTAIGASEVSRRPWRRRQASGDGAVPMPWYKAHIWRCPGAICRTVYYWMNTANLPVN